MRELFKMSHNHPHDHPARPAYFRRGEITLLVAHKPTMTPEDFENWIGQANQTLGVNLRLIDRITYGDVSTNPITTFPNQDGDIIESLLHTILVDPLFDKPTEDVTAEDWQPEDDAVVRAVNTINAAVPVEFEGVTVLAAAPNWLFSSAGHGLMHPTPGASPKDEPKPGPDQHVFDKSEIDQWVGKCAEGQRQVYVAILDAVPPKATSPQAVGQPPSWKGSFSAHAASHAIYKTLQNQMEVQHAADLGIRLPDNRDGGTDRYVGQHDDYDVSDHGTFIAGIVHDIAPNATIRVVEVINHDGAGTVDSFVEGLRALAEGRVIALPKENYWSLIVNCSLVIDCPRPAEDCTIRLPYDLPNLSHFELVLRYPYLVLLPIKAALRHFYSALRGNDVQIVASAGNDGDPNTLPPPPTRYPAAFKSVLGVGALEAGSTRAWYSNLADDPPYEGVVVFGGKANRMTATQAINPGAPLLRWNETDSAGGLLGLYIGMFPVRVQATGEIAQAQAFASKNGWGRWAGTSFSAGVMSGVLAYAAHKGCPISLEQPRSFCKNLIANPSIPRTLYGEVILSAPQRWAVKPTIPMIRFTFVTLVKQIRDFFTR
jgi:Subtilase family